MREARDCSTALLDAQGRLIARAELQPMQTAGLSMSFAACAEQLDLSQVTPGHALILNDPYSGGQHLNDIIIFTPIFHGPTLLGGRQHRAPSGHRQVRGRGEHHRGRA